MPIDGTKVKDVFMAGAAAAGRGSWWSLKKSVSALNTVFNVLIGTSIAIAALDKATDGESTHKVLNGAEAVIGEKGVRAVGASIRDTAEYVGEGAGNVLATVSVRYPSEKGHIPPPLTKPGFVLEGAALSLAHSSAVKTPDVVSPKSAKVEEISPIEFPDGPSKPGVSGP